MTLAEKYFLEFKKQSKTDVTLEVIDDTRFIIHFDVSGMFYLHTYLGDDGLDVQKHVAHFCMGLSKEWGQTSARSRTRDRG